jgi:hypothetical protein
VREGLFIKKNIDKWRNYQYNQASDPDEMAEQFTELVNDLGYSKTFYPQARLPNTSTVSLRASTSTFIKTSGKNPAGSGGSGKRICPLL